MMKKSLSAFVALVLVFTTNIALAKKLTILHYNDVYQIEPIKRGKIGGAARVATLVKQNAGENPLVLFGGDALGSSALSLEFQGQQMVDAFNAIGLDYAVCGNHEFDFGVEVAIQRVKESKFKWLCANMYAPGTKTPIAGMQPTALFDWHGVKVGIVGLVSDWRGATKDFFDKADYESFVNVGKKFVKELQSQGAEVIIALTHMEIEQDVSLANAIPEIDLILGGHDHEPISRTIKDTLIFKAGSDWEFVGKIVLNIENGKVTVASKNNILVDDTFAKDVTLDKLVAKYADAFNQKLAEVIGNTAVDLDVLKQHVRSQETNFGNFIADAYQANTKSDLAIANGGGLRSEAILPKGPITKKVLLNAIPFNNKIVMVELTGAQIKEALEGGLGKIETGSSGGFPHVSKGFKYTFDGSKPFGSRVQEMTLNGKPIDLKKTYSVATNDYSAQFQPYQNAKKLIDHDTADIDFDAVLRFFKAQKTISPKVEGRIVRLDKPQ